MFQPQIWRVIQLEQPTWLQSSCRKVSLWEKEHVASPANRPKMWLAVWASLFTISLCLHWMRHLRQALPATNGKPGHVLECDPLWYDLSLSSPLMWPVLYVYCRARSRVCGDGVHDPDSSEGRSSHPSQEKRLLREPWQGIHTSLSVNSHESHSLFAKALKRFYDTVMQAMLRHIRFDGIYLT